MSDVVAHIYAQIDAVWKHLEKMEKVMRDRIAEIRMKQELQENKMESVLSFLKAMNIEDKDIATITEVLHILDELRKRIVRIEEDYIKAKDLEDLEDTIMKDIRQIRMDIDILRNRLEVRDDVIKKMVKEAMKDELKKEREEVEKLQLELAEHIRKTKDFLAKVIDEVGRIDNLEKRCEDLEKDMKKVLKDLAFVKYVTAERMHEEAQVEMVKNELDERIGRD